MSFDIPQPEDGMRQNAVGLHVPSGGGISKWVVADTYTFKLTAQLTNGSLGLIEASVPPGGGPIAHTHANEDEIFYLLDGELEFLNGDKVFTAGPGDVVFVPRNAPHRFSNKGIRPAKMIFMYTPGGAENFLIECGDDPEPGKLAEQWEPERFAAIGDLMVKYGVGLGQEP